MNSRFEKRKIRNKKAIGSSSIPPSNLKKGSIAYKNLFSIKFTSMSRCFILKIAIA